MAMRLGARRRRVREAHEINVTPFIDVMLVLLIIFMVAAPLATVDVTVDLPPGSPVEPRPDKPIFLTLKADLSLLLGETRCRAMRCPALDAASQRQRGAHLPARRSRRELRRHDAMMNALRDAGYLKVALVGLETGAAQ